MMNEINLKETLQKQLEQYKKELEAELAAILNYWHTHTIDHLSGGFYGKINNENKTELNAPKGLVLNARILWTFSAAYNQTKQQKYCAVAGRAFRYILDYFKDKAFGGVYWSVDSGGNMLDGRKQIYALAFCIYGMSEYYAATQNRAALDFAIELYNDIEKYSYDPLHKGYLEAFSREWGLLDDLRLSAKDANEKKTMNTHLHIIEAYANLYKIWPGALLKKKIEALLFLCDKYFINHKTYHLRLFFDEQWNENADVISYGHDIEAAWLLLQCAEIIEDDKWIKIFQSHAIAIANAAMNGLDNDGGLWYEYEIHKQQLIKEKHWWSQAEAMVGFFNAWQLSGDEMYLKLSINNWKFIQQYLLDKQNGEWFWGVNADYSVMQSEDKAGFWKCPYHNGRACMELIGRIDKMIQTSSANQL
ncbi:MAG TPA: AGE family epimerase/isomerase [Panacibacter sp.]|nr:AGE family epimerase/isomerase [Panacibacter sp.]